MSVNIVCFASGRGSNLRALIGAMRSWNVPAALVLVISNNSAAGALAVARSAGVPARHLSEKQFSSHGEFSRALGAALAQARADIIVLAGYMKKLPAEICRAYAGRILNVHPALLPAFGGAGMYGVRVHEAVLASGARESGATVHTVDEDYDRGAIVLQETVPVLPGDTPETLAARVLEAEHRILPRAVERLAETIARAQQRVAR